MNIEEEDQEKTASTFRHCLHHFARMLFGLENTIETFERIMGVIFDSVEWRFALVFLDDIVIFSKTPEEHIDHVWQVLTLVQFARNTLKLKECFLLTDIND